MGFARQVGADSQEVGSGGKTGGSFAGLSAENGPSGLPNGIPAPRLTQSLATKFCYYTQIHPGTKKSQTG